MAAKQRSASGLRAGANQANSEQFVNQLSLIFKIDGKFPGAGSMTFILFLLYLSAGAGVGYGLFSYSAVGLPLSIAGGAVTSAILGQIHILARAGAATKRIDERLDTLSRDVTDVKRAQKVTDARIEVVEQTVKVELTERRDALVSEMKQLEGLIGRLTQSFEAKLAETSGAKQVSPLEDAVLRDVRDALKDGRVDLHLQPIVSLPHRRVSFYEGFTRLRRPDGSLILPADFLDAGRRAHLMGIIDNLSLFRCVQIVRRLAERDRRVGVFCNIASASLEDPALFPLFHEFMSENRDLSGAVIFELRADKFEQRSPVMRANMEKLAALGFRFSIDHADSLALDLSRLQAAGVRFVKMNGSQLIEQLRDPQGERPVSNINKRLEGSEVSAVFSRYGITMIAEKIEDEASVLEILEYEIGYGQGHVFGAPRPIKASLMEDTAPPQALIDRLSNFG
ncbi:MAG: EAL domain-containing protein [Alphaproteobacteria bacterium]|nr:EAL domain-containing protein [Alphaproteobacteria bacterium]